MRGTAFVALAVVWVGVLAGCASGYVNPRNPCHSGKKFLGKNSSCLVYRLPPKLCQACRLREGGYDAAGKFEQCTNIYDIQAPQCVTELRKYARWNRRCDKMRLDQIENRFNESLVNLDYFVYSVCEECCDCVTPGSEPGEYRTRKRAKTLFDVEKRANCGTHAAADICLVWPNVRRVVNWWKDIPPKSEQEQLPDVCKILRSWRELRKGPSSPLSEEERETVPAEALAFLRNFTKVARCTAEGVWNDCVDLESKQKRI